MKNWQGIPTTRLTFSGEVMVQRDNRTLLFSNYTIPFATQGKIGHYKTSFNYCSSGSGQNSVIPVVCDVPE